jgi:biopolymer transport protein ExbD
MALHIRAGTEPEPLMADINTTPLVDVLLVLLVMLIITIPIQLHAVNLEMPGRNAAPPPEPPTIVQLEVTPAGFVWDGMPVPDRATLELRLREAAAMPQPPEIHVQPHAGVKYEPVAFRVPERLWK